MANPSIVVEFLAETTKLIDSVKDVEKSGQQASGALGRINWRSVAKWGAVAGAAAGTAKLLKDSAESTVDLAKATGQLQRATNLDAETASAWVEVLKVRNISVESFQSSLVKTSKLMDKSRLAQEQLAKVTTLYNEAAAQYEPIIAKGGEAGKEATKAMREWDKMLQKAQTTAAKANLPFTRIGVSLKDVREGRIDKVILEAADGFAKLKNPATRAALAVQLFGRQGLALLPLLMKGSKGIKEQLALADKYHNVIGKKTVKAVGDLVEKQHELQMAQDGVKTQIGSALIPAQVQLYGVALDLINVFLPLTENVDVMTAALGVAAVAFVTYKGVMIVATIAETAFNVQLGITGVLITAGVIVAVIALIAAIGLLIKNWDKVSRVAGQVWAAIKRAARDTLDWFKRNWPIILGVLAGPFGLAVALVYKNWGKITGAVKAGFEAVKTAIANAKTAVVGWGSNVAAWIASGIIGTLTGIGSRAWNVVNNIGAVITQYAGKIKGWGTTIADGIKAGFSASISGMAAIFKGALNAILKLWNKLQIPGFKIKGPGPLPDIKFPAIKFPNIPLLASGGIVTGPTLAMLGERGPEAVIPLGDFSPGPTEVRVFIGDKELKALVRQEVRDQNRRTAQVLLAGRIH